MVASHQNCLTTTGQDPRHLRRALSSRMDPIGPGNQGKHLVHARSPAWAVPWLRSWFSYLKTEKYTDTQWREKLFLISLESRRQGLLIWERRVGKTKLLLTEIQKGKASRQSILQAQEIKNNDSTSLLGNKKFTKASHAAECWGTIAIQWGLFRQVINKC